MTAVKEQQDIYLSTFQAAEKASTGPSWLGEIRRAAMERFVELGFPTTRQEEWRFTNVAPMAKIPFELAQAPKDGAAFGRLSSLPMADLGCDRLVFVNGRFNRELSSFRDLAKGVKACSLAEALASGTFSIEQHLARHARFDDHAFIALNTAFIHDGAYVEIPKGLVLEKPLYLLFVTTANGRPSITHPRNLVIAGPESQATIIEGYLGLGDGTYFTNAVSEVVVGENAAVHYCRLQHESEQAYYFGALHVRLGRDANATTHALDLGAALARQEVAAVLDGEGSECQLNGLYVVNGRQHIDNYTTLDHAKPHTSSREFYKGVLDGKSSGVFNGRIIVRPGRAENRRQAEQQELAALRRRDDQYQAATRDLRRRRQVHPRRHDRPDRPGSDVLSAFARHRQGRGAADADLRFCQRHHRPHQVCAAARAARGRGLRAPGHRPQEGGV